MTGAAPGLILRRVRHLWGRPMMPRGSRWLTTALAAFVLGFIGCGTRYIDEHIADGSPWHDKSGEQFCQGLTLDRTGRASIIFRGPDGPVEVPASYTVPVRKVSSGVIELTYQPTAETAAKYRAAVKWWKATPGHEAMADKMADDLPARERFEAVHMPGLTLTRADGLVIALSPRWDK